MIELSYNEEFIEEATKPHIKVVEVLVQSFTYGDLIPNEWLSDIFNLKLPTYGSKKQFDMYAFEFMGILEGVKKFLLEEHKMYLKNVRGRGYLIVLPKQQSDIAIDTLRRSISTELTKAFKAIINVNEALLTNDDILKRDLNHGRVAAIAAFSKAVK